MRQKFYEWLMENRSENVGYEEARLLSLIISYRLVNPFWTLEDTLGLNKDQFITILKKYFPKIHEAYRNDLCFKIWANFSLKNPFICHCCGRAVSSTFRIVKTDIPLLTGYPPAINRKMEVDDLRDLLLSHRTSNVEEEEWFANMIAVSSLGEDHLWQDLGVTGRADVSYILKTYFTELYLKNNNDMKWKKFFYKQLCEMEEIKVCKAPSCSVCDHYEKCFGPEEAENWTKQELVA